MQLKAMFREIAELGIALVSLSALVLVGCGGGGSSSNSAANSGNYQIVATIPSAPSGVIATSRGGNQIDLSWTAISGVSGYKVYRSGTSPVVVGASNNISSGLLLTNGYSSTGLSPSSTYFYKVTAVNAAGESLGSNEVSATTGASAVAGLMGGTKQGSPLSLNNTVATYAGTVNLPGSTDGIGVASKFFWPSHITTDGSNLYVADMANHIIRKIIISTGAVSILAGAAGLTGSTDGTGANARFWNPQGITTDGANLYVSDANNKTIRKIVISTAAVSTLAGSPSVFGGSADGVGAAARFMGPVGITTDGNMLYVADGNRIRSILISTGAVTTLAGSLVDGNADGTGTAASFFQPFGITTDGVNLFVSDGGNHNIRKIVIASKSVTTLAGPTVSVGLSGITDGNGAAARFNRPYDVTTDGTNLYIADTFNYSIRKIEIATGVVTTIAGVSGVLGAADGVGSSSRFREPTGLTSDGVSLYVSDMANNTIRRIQ